MSLLYKLDELKGRNIVVVGDIIVDEQKEGYTAPSPEAAPYVFKIKRRETLPGGAANVAYNIRTLGSSVTLMGIVGDGTAGDRLQERIKSLDIKLCAYSDGRPANIKSRSFKTRPHNYFSREDNEEEFPSILAPWPDRVINQLVSDVMQHNYEAIVLPDYNKGAFATTLAEQLIRVANAKKIKTFATPKPENLAKFSGAYLVSCNKVEAIEAYHKCTNVRMRENELAGESRLEKLAALAQAITSATSSNYAVITLSEEGMFTCDQKEGPILEPSRVNDEVIDGIGGGDTALAAISIAITAGFSIREALQVGNYAAGRAVEKMGTASVSFKELEERIALFNKH